MRNGIEEQIDRTVATKIRERREALGFSRKAIVKSLGISTQQLQKIESGENRIGVGRLFLISKVLKAEPGSFFEGLE